MIVRLAVADAERRRSLAMRSDHDDFSDVRAVLFDLDGTLVDSEAQVAAAAVEALAVFGLKATEAEILSRLGPPLADLLVEMYGITLEEARRIYREYMRVYAEKHIPQSQPMPGAVALLDALAAREMPLAVVTNKVEEGGRAVVEAVGWAERFVTVVGADTAPRAKPHADPALFALEAMGAEAGVAVLVGDSAADMGCARNAKLRAAIGVEVLSDAEHLVAAGATHVCADLLEVRGLLLGV